jgi:hypothetical protein
LALVLDPEEAEATRRMAAAAEVDEFETVRRGLMLLDEFMSLGPDEYLAVVNRGTDEAVLFLPLWSRERRRRPAVPYVSTGLGAVLLVAAMAVFRDFGATVLAALAVVVGWATGVLQERSTRAGYCGAVPGRDR